MKKHNFFAGPAILPASVILEARKAVKDFADMGLSILEISHRSKQFVAVLEEARSLVKELFGMDEEWEVLFLTGGASTQFFMVPMNLLPEGGRAAYIDTGTWSKKAIKEVEKLGNIDVIASSANSNYDYIPKRYKSSAGASYLHYTSNNTIYGTQFHAPPNVDMRLVCDMSSDVFGRPIDVSKYDLIYAGAQKNLGPAGTTLVMVRKSVMKQSGRNLPTLLNYITHAEKGSSFNTPPVYPIYVCLLTLRWLKSKGGLAKIEKLNKSKARLLYKEIDNSPIFEGKVRKPDRSLMNVTFDLKESHKGLSDAFLAAARKAGCLGLPGHRSVGGFRASIYNAMPRKSVKVLVDVMHDFALKNG